MKPITVLLLNNYSMQQANTLVQRGQYPGQHLYGFRAETRQGDDVKWLLPGFSVYDLGVRRFAPIKSLLSVLVRLIGDPIQQMEALRLRGSVDAVFAADQWSARGLLLLKRLGLVRLPVVVLVHRQPKTRMHRWILRGADRLTYLSAHTAAMVCPSSDGIEVLPWGPDLSSAVYRRAPSDGVIDATLDFVAAGKTNRDYAALRRVAVRHKLCGVIYSGHARSQYDAGLLSEKPGMGSYLDVLDDMARSRCVVVMLRDPEVMSGLTEIADAIALSKPIIVTRSRALPFDVEGSQAGQVIASNSDIELYGAMVRIGRLQLSSDGLAASHNIDTFRTALEATLLSVVAECGLGI